MAEVYAGQEAEFEDEQRKIIAANGREVVVFKHDGRFYAFENNCPHNGGPVGEGILIGKVEAVLGPDQTLLAERFSETETHLVCPWHGWEYNIANGACIGDPKRRLRKYEIVQREDGGVYVVA
jgi:nitrite reductase (NADH) small subunit